MQNLKERINSLEKELAELKKLVGKEDDKIWAPKEDEDFFTILGNGDAVRCYDDFEKYGSYGNYFKTREEAEKQAEYNRVMSRFRKYVEAYSEPLDWDNNEQYKYFVLNKHGEQNEIRYDTCDSLFEDAFRIYASSPEILKDAVIYSAGSEEEFARIVFGGK